MITSDNSRDDVVHMRTRAFNGKLEMNSHVVEPDGEVRVFDNIAKYYTRCHSMSAQGKGRVRAAHRRKQ